LNPPLIPDTSKVPAPESVVVEMSVSALLLVLLVPPELVGT
jgi:hypothetical protein